MDIDRLKAGWQSQESMVLSTVAGGGDMRTLMAKLDTLDRQIRRRDVREYMAACFVMAFFGFNAASTTEPLARIGSLVVVFGSMFIIVWSRRGTGASSRVPVARDLPVASFCARELERLNAQVKLSKSVWWWYLGPTIIGVVLILLGGSAPPMIKGGLVLFVLVIAAVIYWANLSAARTELEPVRDALAERLREFEAEG